MTRTVILEGARTAFGKMGGALASLSASDLGGVAIKEALNRAGVSPETVDEVIMGTVLQAGQGQIPSRQAATKAGIPWSVKTETINKVCASGMRAVTLGDQLIRLGDEEVIVAGGMESMSNAPYYLPKGRFGLRMGDAQMVDGMIYDGLSCSTISRCRVLATTTLTTSMSGFSAIACQEMSERSYPNRRAASGPSSGLTSPTETNRSSGNVDS